MPVADLMLAGVELLLLGMGIVFGFLTVLVFTLHGMSRLATALERRGKPPAGGPVSAALPHPAEDIGQQELTAVISAAVARYRAGRRP